MPSTTAISISDMGLGRLFEKFLLSTSNALSDKTSLDVGLEFLGSESLEFKLNFPSSSALSLRGRILFVGRTEFFGLSDVCTSIREDIRLSCESS